LHKKAENRLIVTYCRRNDDFIRSACHARVCSASDLIRVIHLGGAHTPEGDITATDWSDRETGQTANSTTNRQTDRQTRDWRDKCLLRSNWTGRRMLLWIDIHARHVVASAGATQ